MNFLKNTPSAGCVKLLFLLVLLSPGLNLAQDISSFADTTKRKSPKRVYIGIRYGIQFMSFRDFATSPLLYSGNPISLGLSQMEFTPKRESIIRFAYSRGSLTDNGLYSDAVSRVSIFSFNYLELFNLPNLNSSRMEVKVGGKFNTTANIRDNEVLGNNRDGFEAVSTLFASVKMRLYLHEKIAIRNHSERGNLAIGLNIGLINSAYRNGFIYTRHSPLLNQEKINEGYLFRPFTGYRLNSQLDYSFFLKNGNAIRLSYLWDVYKIGGEDSFEMATHLLSFSLLFHLN